MGFFNKLVNNADGIREQVVESYEGGAKHARQTGTENPHLFGLYSAIHRCYSLRKWHIDDETLRGELAPFVGIGGGNAVSALAEYMVWQERPLDAREEWLRQLINTATRGLSAFDLIEFGVVASTGKFSWTRLLDRQTIAAISKALDGT
jgi:hypothetical protein